MCTMVQTYIRLCSGQHVKVGFRAVAIPGGDATGLDALDGAALELFEDLGTNAKSFQSPEGEKV